MEAVGDADWATYLQLWEEYEDAVVASIVVWMPGGGCAVHPRPVKATRETCTKSHLDSLRESIARVNRITALGRLIGSK